MRSGAKLVDLEADVRSVRHPRTGEMILELNRDKKRKRASYKSLVEEVLVEGVPPFHCEGDSEGEKPR